MNKKNIISIFFIINSFLSHARPNDVYIIYYATLAGKTGHVGIAVDQYRIVFRDVTIVNKTIQIADTIVTGRLLYYDLWPHDDSFSVDRTAADISPKYYKLPASSIEEAITVNSLFDKGIPHKENYPCDGLLRIVTTWQQDQFIIFLLDSMVSSNRAFNGQNFNCTDFVKYPLEKLLHKPIDCKEFVFTGWSNTPNKLYIALRYFPEVKIIKNADDKSHGSFIMERILYNKLIRPKPD